MRHWFVEARARASIRNEQFIHWPGEAAASVRWTLLRLAQGLPPGAPGFHVTRAARLLSGRTLDVGFFCDEAAGRAWLEERRSLVAPGASGVCA
jgi:hypothetical protein